MSKIIKAFQLSDKDVENEEQIFRNDRDSNLYLTPVFDEFEGNHNLEAECNEIVAEAQKEADKILQEADEKRRQAEIISDEAYRKGYEDGKEKGYKKGYRKGQQELNKSIEVFNKAAEQVRKNIQNEEDVNKQIIELATKIAGAVVNTELNINPEIINNIIDNLLQELGNNHQDLIIKVHPDMYHYIEKNHFGSEIKANSPKFTADNSLEKGDCIVETNFGGRDALIADKLELLQEKLYKEAGLHNGGS